MRGLRLSYVQETSENDSSLSEGARFPFPAFRIIEPCEPPARTDGDHREFLDVVGRLEPRIKGVAQKLKTRSRLLDEDDLFQMAVVRLWTEYVDGKVDGKTDSYLLQGCYHHLRNELRLRKNKSEEPSVEEMEGSEGVSWEDALETVEPKSLEEQVEASQLLEKVYAIGLTEKELLVLSLSLEGLTVREIGERLGVSHVQAVKHRNNIRAKCAAVLGEEALGSWRG